MLRKGQKQVRQAWKQVTESPADTLHIISSQHRLSEDNPQNSEIELTDVQSSTATSSPKPPLLRGMSEVSEALEQDSSHDMSDVNVLLIFPPPPLSPLFFSIIIQTKFCVF